MDTIRIQICNLRNTQPTHVYDVRVDRTSVLGNPFHMTADTDEQRVYVCARYAEYFFNKVTAADDDAFMNELRRLYRIAKKYGVLRLFCWCAPKHCHAETISSFLMSYLCTGTDPYYAEVSVPGYKDNVTMDGSIAYSLGLITDCD